jgi:hypothetical protein
MLIFENGNLVMFRNKAGGIEYVNPRTKKIARYYFKIFETFFPNWKE